KRDSPLAYALKRKTASRAGNFYGLDFQGHLTPETVRQGDLEIGLFEVTRAQYAQFDENYRVEAGKENYPAGGIAFAQAQAYCQWLSRLTGENYRLGNEAEMAPIYELSSAEENTLDYWAGYRLNPDDAGLLQDKIKELGGGAPLLKEVGSFKAGGME